MILYNYMKIMWFNYRITLFLVSTANDTGAVRNEQYQTARNIKVVVKSWNVTIIFL